MTYMTTEPPINPPEYRLVRCDRCEGTGFITCDNRETDECPNCEGTGEAHFDPDNNPFAPDTWKEAEGWS